MRPAAVTVGDKTCELVQFHFHHRSETEINSQRSPMEPHLVHQDKDGNIAVVAVLLNEGQSNPLVNTVWSQLSQQEGQEIAPEHVEINALNLLPANHHYYTFPGSLTTPPRSENVTWLVLATPMTLSKEQIASFAAIYPNNARPVQP